MRCLITGISGYIGSALAKRLIQQGHQVTGLLHQSPLVFEDEQITIVHGDLTDQLSIQGLCKDIDIVFHCAGETTDFARKKMYYNLHVNGTKNLVKDCKNHQCKRFIYLSHLFYEDNFNRYFYPHSKMMAESYLQSLFQNESFPMVIIRPGNVYGPYASTWVKRPLISIKNKRIALIHDGKGIFHHTYIDNLIDSLMLVMNTSKIEGEIFEITDGDNSISWAQYFNDLSEMIGMKPISKHISKNTAKLVGRLMVGLYHLFHIKPFVTPYAVEILSNTKRIDITKAKTILHYSPRIDYHQGMKRIKDWLSTIDVDDFLSE